MNAVNATQGSGEDVTGGDVCRPGVNNGSADVAVYQHLASPLCFVDLSPACRPLAARFFKAIF